jgi:hypothetical protein
MRREFSPTHHSRVPAGSAWLDRKISLIVRLCLDEPSMIEDPSQAEEYSSRERRDVVTWHKGFVQLAFNVLHAQTSALFHHGRRRP